MEVCVKFGGDWYSCLHVISQNRVPWCLILVIRLLDAVNHIIGNKTKKAEKCHGNCEKKVYISDTPTSSNIAICYYVCSVWQN